MELNKIYNENCLTGLNTLPDNCIDCCVTSPPYFGLRDYGTASWEGGDINCDHTKVASSSVEKSRATSTIGYAENTGHSLDTVYKDVCRKCGAKRSDEQIGLEETPELYVSKLVEVFTEVKRVLKNEGTLWLNLGDSYAANRGGTHQPAETLAGGKNGKTDEGGKVNRSRYDGYNPTRNAAAIGLKHKDLIGTPWMVAFALRSSGWYLRQDIIWHKPNPMPESVTDRCTKSHEYIFLMSKSQRYYYDADAIKTESKNPIDDIRRMNEQTWDNKNTPDKLRNGIRPKTKSTFGNRNGVLNALHSGKPYYAVEKANKRSVWTVNTMPYSEAHFATFPERLITDCIKAGCPENGIVLDPFMGAGTTALVAKKLNRNYIGFELNTDYIKIAEKRLYNQIGLFR